MCGFFSRCLLYTQVCGIIITGLLGFHACSKGPAACLGKNVLLISIDTCRADHVQPYADDQSQTPNLKQIASEGIWFEDALTPVPLTLPAHCSLLTGLHPVRHGVRSNYNYVLNKEAVTLAELFSESGYATGGIIGSMMISRREGLSQGFDYYDDQFLLEEYQAMLATVERPAGRVVASATAWLQDHLENTPEKPFFLFLHFYDPHKLYQPPPPFDTQYGNSSYNGEIAYVDSCIGQLFQFLKENGLYEDLLLITVADHGEGLGNHNDPNHGLFLYEEAVRVPFYVKLPEGRQIANGSAASKQSVSILDVMPTLIDLCGLGVVNTDGISLKPWLLDGAPVGKRNLVCETLYPLTYNWSPMYALRNQEWKYIHSPLPELYDLKNDAKEKNNRIASSGTPLQEMQAELEERLIQLAQGSLRSESQQISTDRMETLASLGYAAGGMASGLISPGKPLPDPKEKLEVYLLVDKGLGLLASGYHHQSIELFEKAMQLDPENPTPYVNIGLACAKTKQWDKALEFTRKAVELSPENLLAQIQLTRLCVMRNKLKEGKQRLEAILNDFPQLAEAHYQLGELYKKQNDHQAALHEFELAKRWMPDMPGIDELILKAKEQLGTI